MELHSSLMSSLQKCLMFSVFKICLLFTVFHALYISNVYTFQSCPSICTCKWKNGKRNVECRDKHQISVPSKIDPMTQVLDLSGNNLQILPIKVFSRYGLLNLQQLHLASCSIGQIDPSAFRGLTNLVLLNLSGNLLTSVPTATFSNIPYLRILDLSHNPLQKLEVNAFEMIPDLINLDLSWCNIKRVAARTFTQLVKLERLNIAHNSISVIKQKTVDSVYNLHSIELSGNPWVCDCRLRSLKEWLYSENIPYNDETFCAEPPRLKGKMLKNLKIDAFACRPEVHSGSRLVEVNQGENATLICRVSSVPKSRIKWFRDGSEILNNSLINRGRQRLVIYESGEGFEKTSKLFLNNVIESNGGNFICVSRNQAGRARSNFTLKVSHFSPGIASLMNIEIVGIILAALILLFIILSMVFIRYKRRRQSLLKSSSPSSTNNNIISSDDGVGPNGLRQFSVSVAPSSVQMTLSQSGPNPLVKPPRTLGSGNFTPASHFYPSNEMNETHCSPDLIPHFATTNTGAVTRSTATPLRNMYIPTSLDRNGTNVYEENDHHNSMTGVEHLRAPPSYCSTLDKNGTLPHRCNPRYSSPGTWHRGTPLGDFPSDYGLPRDFTGSPICRTSPRLNEYLPVEVSFGDESHNSTGSLEFVTPPKRTGAWIRQQGGIQVLPPLVSNGGLKRVAGFRGESPDEGIQDDCSTDV